MHLAAGAAEKRSTRVRSASRFARRVVTAVDIPLGVPGRAGGIANAYLGRPRERIVSPELVVRVAVTDEESSRVRLSHVVVAPFSCPLRASTESERERSNGKSVEERRNPRLGGRRGRNERVRRAPHGAAASRSSAIVSRRARAASRRVTLTPVARPVSPRVRLVCIVTVAVAVDPIRSSTRALAPLSSVRRYPPYLATAGTAVVHATCCFLAARSSPSDTQPC